MGNMSDNKQSTFRIVDIDFECGLTVTTMVGKDKLTQQHIPLSVIENFFGGNPNKAKGEVDNNEQQ